MTSSPATTRPVELPAPGVLAALISEVTTTMLGMSFALADGHERIELLCWRSAVLPIGRGTELQVALASDQRGCALLGSRMFQVALADVDATMIDDTLCELVNMAAGMIKRALGADMALGLPRIVAESHTPRSPVGWNRLLLRTGDGAVELVLFVSQPVVSDGEGREVGR